MEVRHNEEILVVVTGSIIFSLLCMSSCLASLALHSFMEALCNASVMHNASVVCLRLQLMLSDSRFCFLFILCHASIVTGASVFIAIAGE